MSNVIAGADRAAVRRNAETHSELLDYVAPRLGRPAAPVILAAAAVGASRVVTGVHDPSYLLAGFDASQDLGRWLRMAAGNARILGVASGDGTVSAGAAVALKMGLPFIPAGTFNHFAADRGLRSVHARRKPRGRCRQVAGRPHHPRSGAAGRHPRGRRGPPARSRLIVAVLTDTLGRCRVYHAWQARSVDISSARGTPIWLSVDRAVATAESAFRGASDRTDCWSTAAGTIDDYPE